MTLSTTASRVNYPGAGSVGPFAIPFRFTSATDLLVTRRSSVGVETTLANVTDFTTTGAGNATGTLTLTTALAAGETLSIRRAPTLTQATSIRNQGPYFPATHEDVFDRLVMQMQSLQDQVDRSFGLAESYDPAAVATRLKPEIGKALVWQSATQLGNSTLDASAVALPGEGRTVATLTAYLLNNRVFNVLDYAPVGYIPGVTGASAMIQAAVDAVPAGGGVVSFPPLVFLFDATVTIPVDRRVFIVGSGNGYLEGATPRYEGTVWRRAAGFTDTMMQQTGTASPQNFQGVSVTNLAIVGDLLAGDGFELDYINVAQFDNVTFARLTGHAIKAHGLQNSWFRQCRWYRNGDATHEVVLLDATATDSVGSQGVDFIGCTWENNHGIDLLLTNATDTATVGTSNINVIGGKFEQSLAVPPGVPFVKIIATQTSQFRTLFQNGQHHDATHVQIGETGNALSFVRRLLIDSQFSVFSTVDSVNPRYLVDVQDGGGANALSSVIIRGTFHRGAGDGGAQIRVAAPRAAGFGRVMIDPSNVYTTPLSGVPVSGQASNGVSDDRGDATQTIVWGVDPEIQRFNTTLTANRVVHVSRTAESGQAVPARGARFRVVRKGLGAFTLTVLNGFSGTTIRAIPSGTAAWLDVEFDGTDWVETGYGTL